MVLSMLQRQIEAAHEHAVEYDMVTFIVDDVQFKCSRPMVSTWSAPFASLVRDGHGPLEVQLDISLAMFRPVWEFTCSGVLPDDAVRHISSNTHPLLEYAERQGLRELKEAYFEHLEANHRINTCNAPSELAT